MASSNQAADGASPNLKDHEVVGMLARAAEAAGVPVDVARSKCPWQTFPRSEDLRVVYFQRCVLAYYLRSVPLPDGTVPSYPVIAFAMGLRSHSQALELVRLGRMLELLMVRRAPRTGMRENFE